MGEGCVGAHPTQVGALTPQCPLMRQTRRGHGFWRWDVAAAGEGADWATCLRLLEHAAATAAVTCDGASSTASLSTTTTMTASLVGILTPDDLEEASAALAVGGRGPPAAQDGHGGS